MSIKIFEKLVEFLKNLSLLKAWTISACSSAFISSIIDMILYLLQKSHLFKISEFVETWIIYEIKLIFMIETHLFWSSYEQWQMSLKWWLVFWDDQQNHKTWSFFVKCH